ncbi:MAG: Bax inhibitor-1/YccA family protein [Elusimicrobia bacterium]|nr:Bax inhibitor-1/YccA family protein [Elusimicrobiota bacterium]
MRSSNPTLNENAFRSSGFAVPGRAMTIQGTVNKTLILLAVLLVAAGWIWNRIIQPSPVVGLPGYPSAAQIQQGVLPFIFAGGIGGLIFAFVTIFKKEWAMVTAPLYAACEGLVLGGLSAFFEIQYPGIVVQAVGLTFATLFCLLMAYKSGMIRATEKFKLGIFVATAGIALFYFIVWIVGMFGVSAPGFVMGSTPLGIGFSLFVVGIAALNLILDFDIIERGAESGAPEYMEWYGAFGLMVTLVWLYMEILRLLSKVRSRN